VVVRKQLRDLKFETDAEAEYRQQLNDRLRAKQDQIRKLTEEKSAAEKASADVPTRVGDIQKQLDLARKEKSDLMVKLTKTETDLKRALAQRDEALAQVTQMKEAQKQVDKLIADNASLMVRLGEAEKTVTQVRADGVKKDQEIAALRKEATSLKEQLSQAQKESGDYQRQMAALQQKLNDANTQIGQMKADNAKSLAERTRLQDENQILRGVVLRQQKEEARRAQTKKLVLAELAKLEGKSKVLMDQIEYLSGPVVKLNAKERALFKKPELQISDTEISLSAARSEDVPGATESPTPASELPAVAKVDDAKPAAGTPKVETSATGERKAGAESAGSPETPKVAANEKPSEPMPPAESKPSLSLETGAKPELELASNKTPAQSLSSLPDVLKPSDKPEKGSPSKPSNVAEDLPSKAPDAQATKSVPNAEAAPGEQVPAVSASTGGSNSGGTMMNLPAELVPQAREGKDQFERGNYREAEKIYERILTKAPNNLYTLSNLGVVYFRGSKLKRAEEMFKKAIAISPEDGFSHCTLGIVYYSQQKFDEAVNELTKRSPLTEERHRPQLPRHTASQKGWQEAALKGTGNRHLARPDLRGRAFQSGGGLCDAATAEQGKRAQILQARH
jgi:tetratricopeptide (TPR) repeat protein